VTEDYIITYWQLTNSWEWAKWFAKFCLLHSTVGDC